jgi:hypothetical protein
MRRRSSTPLMILFTSLTVGTCVFPTERDDAVHVSIDPLPILIRGTDTVATARAWQILSAGDSQQLANVSFVWSSDDPATATVDAAGHIVGIKSGTTMIRARAANFDRRSLAGADTLRVSAPLEIDSIRPEMVRYGETVTVYGVGVDSIFQASLAGAILFPYPFSNGRDSTGYAHLSFWVPPPARTDSLFFIGNGVFGFTHDSVQVLRRDIYEPNETAPWVVNLDTSRPFPGTILDPLLFLNPALAFEALPRDVKQGVDWYRFTQTTTRDLTVILTAGEAAGTFATFLTDSLGFRASDSTYFIGRNSWTFGPSSHACHGLLFAPPEAVADSTVVAMKGVPPGALDAIALYGQAARYGFTVIEGYVSERPPDAHEDDNSCNAADRRDTVPAPFRDTLTIENPHAIDWIRFHYTQGGLGSSAQVRLHAFPSIQQDSVKDLDVYVIRVPQVGDPALQVMLADTAAGSDVNRTAPLATGDYYLAVVDFAGTTTTYEVCVGVLPLLGPAFCNTAFPSPPPAGSRPAAASKLRPRYVPRLHR